MARTLQSTQLNNVTKAKTLDDAYAQMADGQSGLFDSLKSLKPHACADCAGVKTVGPKAADSAKQAVNYSFDDVSTLARRFLDRFGRSFMHLQVYGIPRGGVHAAYAILAHAANWSMVDRPEDADVFIDDIIDSGATKKRYASLFPNTPFYALVDKTQNPELGWVTFPWEKSDNSGIDDNIRRLLQFVGENPDREGLLETPKRVAKAWQHWTSGYNVDIAGLLKVFEDGAEGYDEMVVRKNIRIHSHCEHHLAPIIGDCTIAYIPNGKVLGLSKLDRLADAFARRLQVQERLTVQIADALVEHLNPLGVGVYINAEHLCVASRGVQQQCSDTVTTALRGVIKTDPAARAEFLSIARG